MSSPSFGVVVVTYNRIEHLKKTIYLYTAQSVKPVRIVVVDNCSTDGTNEFLKEWEKQDEGVIKEVISLNTNTGGSGGFHAGLERIQKYYDIDWIWVADDDAYPDTDAFLNAKSFIEKNETLISDCSAICGVCGCDNHISPIQRSFLKKTVFGMQEFPVPEKYYAGKNYFEIELYSFVGTLLKRENLIKAGLPDKSFFIYQDDLEHSVRMWKTGKIYCVTSIKITHKDNVAPSNEATWRDYYASRNLIYMYKKHFGKWSLICRIIRRKLFSLCTFNFAKIKVVNAGIKDGLNGNMGINDLYKPGWKA